MAAIHEAINLAQGLFEALEASSRNSPGVTRASFSSEEDEAHRIVARAASDLGMTVTHDLAGNQYMTLRGADEALPAVFIGSHMDSVDHGGNFDGAAGVILGLATTALLQAAGVRLRRNLTVMAIRAEELVWFPTPYCGSRMAFGLLGSADYDAFVRSDTGRSLASHMREGGWDPDALMAGHRCLDPNTIAVFIEPHIEQGPVLDRAGEAVGIVTGIRGNRRYRNGTVGGEWAHAGAVPREARRDAVRAGAAFVSVLETVWDEYDRQGHDFVSTIGEFWTDPTFHAMTKVAGHVRFTLDMRSLDEALLERTDQRLRREAQRISEKFGVSLKLGDVTIAPAAVCDAAIRASMVSAACAAGLEYREMASGAGHDCAVFAAQGVASAMIFIRNQNGSHNPDEAMRIEDFAAGLQVLTPVIEDLVRR